MNPNQQQTQSRPRGFSARSVAVIKAAAAAITASALNRAREIENRESFNYRAMWYVLQ